MKFLPVLIAGLVLALPATAQVTGDWTGQAATAGTGSGGGELPATVSDNDASGNLPAVSKPLFEEIAIATAPSFDEVVIGLFVRCVLWAAGSGHYWFACPAFKAHSVVHIPYHAAEMD